MNKIRGLKELSAAIKGSLPEVVDMSELESAQSEVGFDFAAEIATDKLAGLRMPQLDEQALRAMAVELIEARVAGSYDLLELAAKWQAELEPESAPDDHYSDGEKESSQ